VNRTTIGGGITKSRTHKQILEDELKQADLTRCEIIANIEDYNKTKEFINSGILDLSNILEDIKGEAYQLFPELIPKVEGTNGSDCPICLESTDACTRACIKDDGIIDQQALSLLVWYCPGCKHPGHVGCLLPTVTIHMDFVVNRPSGKFIAATLYCPVCRHGNIRYMKAKQGHDQAQSVGWVDESEDSLELRMGTQTEESTQINPILTKFPFVDPYA